MSAEQIFAELFADKSDEWFQSEIECKGYNSTPVKQRQYVNVCAALLHFGFLPHQAAELENGGYLTTDFEKYSPEERAAIRNAGRLIRAALRGGQLAFTHLSAREYMVLRAELGALKGGAA